ncbi:MAG: AI-2E family transporter [Parafilimonas sp.]
MKFDIFRSMQLPLTVKRSIELLGLVLLGFIIHTGQQIIMPMLMAFFVSIVLLPVYNFLTKRKFPRVLAIFLALLLMIVVMSLIIFFIVIQTQPVIDNFSTIKENISNHINALSKWISRSMNVSIKEQTTFLNQQSQKSVDYLGGILTGAAGSIGSVIIFFGLLPIYTFLILFYKDILVKFIYLWFQQEDSGKVRESISEAESIIQSYIGGLLIQITYITILLGGALLILGIPYALLIGIIFAILNLIPYIGALFGNIIGVLLTLSSSPNLNPVITVLITIAIVQFLDNNILMPRIVGGKVKINALASLAGVFVGGAIAGIPGMFLSLPLIAVAKVIFERTERFKQWAVLFGDKLPKKRFAKRKQKKTE